MSPRIGGEWRERAKSAGRTKLDYRQWVQVRTPAFKGWFGDWENGLAGRVIETGRDRAGNAAGDGSGLTDGLRNVRGGGAVSDVVLNPDTREPRALVHGTADDITAFDLNHPNRKNAGIQGRGIQQGIHGNAGCDRWLPAHGYQHGYRQKRTLRPMERPRRRLWSAASPSWWLRCNRCEVILARLRDLCRPERT